MPRKARAVERERDRGDREAANAEEPERHERIGGARLGVRRTRRAGSRRRRTGRAPRRSPSPRRRCGSRRRRAPAGRRWPSTAPVKSNPRAVPRLSVRKYGAATIPTIATGTLTKKIHSQPALSTSTPPATTPSVPPMPASAPQMPSARLRSRPAGNVTWSSASAAGESSAAPTPWIARTAISMSDGGRRTRRRAKRRRRARGRSGTAGGGRAGRSRARRAGAGRRRRACSR